jgi:transposase
MSEASPINITESIQHLKHLQQLNKSSSKKLLMLILIKENPTRGKVKMASELGVAVRTVQNWRQLYAKGGIELLLQENRGKTGGIPDKLFVELTEFIASIPDEQEYRRGKHVAAWLEDKHNIVMSQDALRKYLHRHFGKSQKRKKYT